ncbi:VanW family protein [Irregularibacter muris]|uniref:VanW family protein n=1 Tax=Irregularibacter muris TaxID=1796619 RepID=A0AAE3HDT6_9FIRM|nr:VanW family protein [Irregularibacter muris]MCR1897605.1 VanW family protein [Irregularibacter muris]
MQGEEVKSKKPNYLILASIGIIAIAILLFCYLGLLVSKDIIYPNIKIEGINIGYLTKEEAKEKITEKYSEKPEEKKLEVFYGKQQWSYTYDQLGVSQDVDKTLEEAYESGKEGNLFHKMNAYISLKSKGKNLSMKVAMDKDKIKEITKKLNEEIKQDAVDAKIKFEKDKFITTKEKNGLALKEEETISLLEESITQKKNQRIELPVITTAPKIKEEMLKGIKEKMVGFSTKFNGSSWQRGQNIKIAASKIDGKIVLPGEVFSINQVISPITKDNGYLDAPVIVDGQLEPGVGGGVCQVSTTMFNAAVRANLEIVERRHHSFPVHYVPIGQDAMISGDWSDMKFKNTLDSPIYIQMYVNGSTLTTNIYGDNNGVYQEIKLQTDILSTLAPKISYKEDKNQYKDYKKEEKTPKTGYKANVYKVIYKNGKQIKKELLHRDYYRPVNGLIVVGTKEKEVSKEKEKPKEKSPKAPTKPKDPKPEEKPSEQKPKPSEQKPNPEQNPTGTQSEKVPRDE